MSSFAIRSRGLCLPFSQRFDLEYVTISANIGFFFLSLLELLLLYELLASVGFSRLLMIYLFFFSIHWKEI